MSVQRRDFNVLLKVRLCSVQHGLLTAPKVWGRVIPSVAIEREDETVEHPKVYRPVRFKENSWLTSPSPYLLGSLLRSTPNFTEAQLMMLNHNLKAKTTQKGVEGSGIKFERVIVTIEVLEPSTREQISAKEGELSS